MPENSNLKNLILKSLRNPLTSEEEYLLNNWKPEDFQNLLGEEFPDADDFKKNLRLFHEAEKESVLLKERFARKSDLKIIKIWDRIPRRWLVAVAATVVLLIPISIFLYKFLNPSVRDSITFQGNDVDPGTTTAFVRFANYVTVNLGITQDGSLGEQGQSRVVKKNGVLSYQSLDFQDDSQVVNNTLFVPRGGNYQLELPDGSKVWLNAQSTIKYPTSFTSDSTREVDITGEAFFEVVQTDNRPFKVKINSTDKKPVELQVGGTSFNVMAYDDEQTIVATVLDGQIRINHPEINAEPQVVLPGQQYVVGNNQPAKIVAADTASAFAWKNGKFEFHNATIPFIMRQLEKWYNFDVRYEGEVSEETYSGIISRQIKLKSVLTALKMVGIKFTVKGKILIVGF
jgi:transmembrane sensor